MATAPTDFNPLFQDSLDFVKTIVFQAEQKHDIRMEPEDIADLLMEDIKQGEDSALKRKWMRVNKVVKGEKVLNFAQEAQAMRKNTGWKW